MRYLSTIWGIIAGAGLIAAVFVIGNSFVSNEPSAEKPLQSNETELIVEESPTEPEAESEEEIVAIEEPLEEQPPTGEDELEDGIAIEESVEDEESIETEDILETKPVETEIVVLDEEAETQPDQNLNISAEIPSTDWDESSRELAKRAELWNFERELVDYDQPDPERILPPSMNVILAETVDYRLDQIDLDGMAPEIALALWPDSPLTLLDREYFLINPPTDIMEIYYVQAVVGDEYDFYFDTMEKAAGVFIRNDKNLVALSPLSELFMKSMVAQGKEVILRGDKVAPEISSQARRLRLDMFESDADLTDENFDEQWSEALQSALHGEDLQVIVEARGDTVEKLRNALNDLKREKQVQSEEVTIE